jgi:hypothetical protein
MHRQIPVFPQYTKSAPAKTPLARFHRSRRYQAHAPVVLARSARWRARQRVAFLVGRLAELRWLIRAVDPRIGSCRSASASTSARRDVEHIST